MSLLWNNNTEERRRRPPSTEEEAAGLGRRTRRRRRLGNPNHNQTGKQSVVITAAAGVASRRHRHSLRRWARNPRGYSLEARRASFHTVQRVWEQSHTGRSIPHDDMTHGASSRNTRTGAVTDTPSPLPPPSAFFHTTNAHAKITTPTTTTTIVHQKRAALRGRQRGLQESNERSDTNHIHHRPTTSIPLVHRSRDEDEDSPYSQSPRLGGANQLIYRQNRRLRVHTAAKNNKQNNTTNTTTTEVWMCGVCGMAFADRSMADGHERRHLATVVAGLLGVNAVYDDTSKSQIATRIPSSSPLPAWMPPNDNNNNNPNGRIPLAAAKAQQQQFVPEKVRFAAASNGNDENDSNDVNSILLLDEAFPPEPRNRHKDYTNNISDTDDNDSVFQFLDHEPPSAFSNNKNNDGEDALLLSRDMKEQVVLADEALVDVVSRAVPMILTAAERDAELELALLARDKAYYDELSRRAMARQVNPSNRFRSDGEDVLAKVQNKFLDAYQIMKESDGKKGITDQYNRQGKSGPGGEAAQSILVHSDRTLYINVMVKNSVQVVRYELERLAKQRWEMVNNDAMGDESNGNHNNNAHNNTNRKAHPRLPHIVKDHADKTTPAAATVGPPLLLTRFERFRVYTQINVVKLAGIALASDFTVRIIDAVHHS